MTGALASYLKQQIRLHGPLDIGRFMSLALGHHEHGYYMKRDPFGAQGDFTTAPEISQMFGEIIGAWVADVWMQLGRPDPFMLLECGPGRGTLMQDIMRATQKVHGFTQACRIHLLETSRVLRSAQAQVLQNFLPSWHDTLGTLPAQGPLIVMANEFLDALPIRQLIGSNGRRDERVVSYTEGRGFYFDSHPAGPDMTALVPEKLKDAEGIFEVSPARLRFIRTLCALLKEHSGAALLIDYGHSLSAPGDTLQAVYKHRYAPVLENIGDADLTAHVDFAVLKTAAHDNSVKVWGPVGQGHFLKTLGIEERAKYLAGKSNAAQKTQIESALHRLTHLDQMGAMFKIMGLSHDDTISPAGF